MLLKQRRQKATACQDATLPDRIALSFSGCVKHPFSSTPPCISFRLPSKPRSLGASPDDPSALGCVNLYPVSCQSIPSLVILHSPSIWLPPSSFSLSVRFAHIAHSFVSGCRRSTLDDNDNVETRRPRPSSSGTHASRASGLRMMLGWKGVKQHLPSRVAKAVPLLLSKKKREKHGADGSAKEDPGRYILLWRTGETGKSIKTGNYMDRIHCCKRLSSDGAASLLHLSCLSQELHKVHGLRRSSG